MAKTMRAAVLVGPGRMQIDEVARPDPGAGQVRVQPMSPKSEKLARVTGASHATPAPTGLMELLAHIGGRLSAQAAQSTIAGSERRLSVS